MTKAPTIMTQLSKELRTDSNREFLSGLAVIHNYQVKVENVLKGCRIRKISGHISTRLIPDNDEFGPVPPGA